MKSVRIKKFRRLQEALPSDVQEQLEAAYRMFMNDPYHSSLQFKRVNRKDPVYSVRIGDSYRALGWREEDDRIVWFWIGTHKSYNKLI